MSFGQKASFIHVCRWFDQVSTQSVGEGLGKGGWGRGSEGGKGRGKGVGVSDESFFCCLGTTFPIRATFLLSSGGVSQKP